MRIGFLTCDLTHKHGWAHYSLELIQGLYRAGAEVTVVASYNSPTNFEFPVTPLLPSLAPQENRTLLQLMLCTPRAATLLRNCDIIHTTVEPFAPSAALIVGKRPLLISGVGTYVQLPHIRGALIGTIYRAAFKRAQMFPCISHYTERILQQTMPGVPSTVIPLGVGEGRFDHVTPADVHKEHPTILAVGAVKARKGIVELVEAIPDVRQRIPDVQCVIIGSLNIDPVYVEKVRATIERLGLQECVHLLGHVSEETLAGWYQSADVFALPSINANGLFEGFGLVHLEASAAGLPVIGTRDCGAEDAIDDGVTGFLVSQTEVGRELPEALIKILTDADLRASMSSAGRAKAKRQTWDYVAEQMMTVYKNLLQ